MPKEEIYAAGLGAAGGLLSTGTSAWASKTQQRRQQVYNRENMATAQRMTRELRQTNFQDQVKDMRAAGLNPMMMYATGGGSGSASAAAVGGASGSGVKGEISQAASASAATAAQIKRIKQEIKESEKRMLTETVKQVNMATERGSIPGKVTQDLNRSLLTEKLLKKILPGYKTPDNTAKKQSVNTQSKSRHRNDTMKNQ